MKLAILFGSSSNERDVSTLSAYSIITNLNKDKYDITPIYLDEQNNFFIVKDEVQEIDSTQIGIKPKSLKKIKHPFEELKKYDLIFNIIHGSIGEDGTMSSILDFLNIPYVGNSALSSMITMDKILAKNELEKNNIKTSKYLYFSKYNDHFLLNKEEYTFDTLIEEIQKEMSFPLFIKPSSSGSSIGITKSNTKEELIKGIKEALKIDNRVLIEEEVIAQELECAILEKDNELIASVLGEISTDSFYSFDAKYKKKGSTTTIPANVDKKTTKEIQTIAKKAFQILGLHGYSRIDFFYTKDKQILINEINTIPGFTTISMYPKLLEESGYSYSEVLDILINEALKK